MTAHPMHREGDGMVKEYLRDMEAATAKVTDMAALKMIIELRETELIHLRIRLERLKLNGSEHV